MTAERDYTTTRDHAAGHSTAADASPLTGLLALQRQVGNRAVTAMLTGARAAPPPPSRPAAPVVQRSATMDLAAWNGGAQDTDTYTMGLDALTDDIVGHAWVDLKENGGKGRSTSIGFWPTLLSALPTGAPGVLNSPDPHAGQAMHRQTATIDRPSFLRVLNVVNAWEGAYYQLLFHNCADFARAAWRAGDPTFATDGIINESGYIYTPGDTGAVIDAANKAKGLDPKGNPLPTAANSPDAGTPDGTPSDGGSAPA